MNFRVASILGACVVWLSGTPCWAADVFAPRGQPMCTEKDKLQEMILALVQKDMKWLESLEGCIVLNKRSKFAVIEEFDGSELGHVVKGRLFGVGGSFVAYTLNIGLEGLEKNK
jgi:hypothetical protein